MSFLSKSGIERASITANDELKLAGIVFPENTSEVAAPVCWAIVKSGLNVANYRNIPGIIYQSDFYTDSSGESIGISHLFRVKLKTDSDKDKLYEMADKYKVEVLGYNEFLTTWYTLSCDIHSEDDALQMANLFYESGLFEASEPDIMTGFKFYSNPNDTYFSQQWNLSGTNSINWLPAHQITQGDNVTVAVIDSGIDQLHPDLANVIPTYDTFAGSWFVAPIYGPHGTACAGIIGATVNNNIGIAGIAPDVDILSISVSMDSPNVAQNFATGLSIAASSADVISNSWGGPPASIIDDAIYLALWTGRGGNGSVVVFASGNNNSSLVSFPANSHDGVIAVGATNQNDTRWNGSNFGTALDIMAPGVNIRTTDLSFYHPEEYSSTQYTFNFTGTSAACPHVAAVAALMLSVNNDLTYQDVSEILEQTAQKKGGYSYTTTSGRPNGTWNIQMGYGVVNAYAAVSEAQNRL
jgi:subtilisin family serine protease